MEEGVNIFYLFFAKNLEITATAKRRMGQDINSLYGRGVLFIGLVIHKIIIANNQCAKQPQLGWQVRSV